ncbi:MAG: FAD:protein FMN transferase [Oscillospiraceae bacterium]|nr:FAD:protein FMN transferase [Oscillospiraceae bacterium]
MGQLIKISVRAFCLIVFLPLAFLFCGCGKADGVSNTFFAMDTAMMFTIYGRNRESALEACRAEVYRLDELLSITNPDSDISRINAAAGSFVEVSSETAELVAYAKALSKQTGGAFDITICPITAEWGFFSKEYKAPEQAEIDSLLELIGSDRIEIIGSEVKLAAGQSIELGAIAKGYLTNRIFDILEQKGIGRAVISLGGNVLVLGQREDKTPWRVGIEDPKKPREYFAILAGTDISVITSGDYQRYFEEDGKRYHHIFDPKTGYPADSGLSSATVIARDGTFADGLSTALFVMGEEGAVEYWRNEGGFEMILVDTNENVTATPGLADKLVLVENSGYRLVFLDG